MKKYRILKSLIYLLFSKEPILKTHQSLRDRNFCMDIVKYERLRSISNVGNLYLRGSMFDLEGIKRSQDIEDELN